MKFGTADFYKNFSAIFQFWWDQTKMTATLLVNLHMFLCVAQVYLTKYVFEWKMFQMNTLNKRNVYAQYTVSTGLRDSEIIK